MEYRHLKFFVAVAEELHFTRASVRLCIAQPHLSQEIRRLEREIGVELFVRTKRSVTLTTAGRAFLERVRIVMDNTADAVHVAQRASRGEIGRISFVGDRQRLTVRGIGERPLLVDAPNTLDLKIGERIRLAVDPHAVRILAGESV